MKPRIKRTYKHNIFAPFHEDITTHNCLTVPISDLLDVPLHKPLSFAEIHKLMAWGMKTVSIELNGKVNYSEWNW